MACGKGVPDVEDGPQVQARLPPERKQDQGAPAHLFCGLCALQGAGDKDTTEQNQPFGPKGGRRIKAGLPNNLSAAKIERNKTPAFNPYTFTARSFGYENLTRVLHC